MLEGLTKIKSRVQQTSNISDENRIRYLTIGNDESAMIRFLTDAEEVISERFHNVVESTPAGDRRRRKRCTKEELGNCEYCAAGEKSSERMFLWAYVTEIYHNAQNPKLETDSDAPRWKMQKAGGKNVYTEVANKPMILGMGVGQKGVLKQALINFAEENGTLCDRLYKWTRAKTGTQQFDVTYSLMPKDATAAPKELEDIKAALPSLVDVILGKTKSMSEESGEGKDSLF